MTTGQDWIEATRNRLLSGRQAERNSLQAGYTAGSGTLVLSGALGGIVPGVRLAVGTNTFYVRSVNNAGLTATVFGGQEGTTDVDAASGATVWVAPYFTDADIFGMLNVELADLSAPGNGLFRVSYTDLTYSSGAIGYNLAVTDLIDIFEVRAQASGSYLDWPAIPKYQWRLDTVADTAIFPSGYALQIFGTAWQGLKVRVLYRQGFTALATPASDTATTGLPVSAYDLPPLGAAVRLVAPREIKRNFTETQSDTRRASEVPPGAVMASMRGLAMLREQRIQSEAQKLDARFPARRW